MKTKKKRSRSKRPKQEYLSFLPIAADARAALYYGFLPIRNLSVSKDDGIRAAGLKESWTRNPAGLPWLFSHDFAEERAALFRHFAEKNLLAEPQPVMLVHETAIVKERGKTTVNLEVMGTKKSIAEALIIQATVSMLRDNGYENLLIEINTIGDKESSAKFSRELANYYKKNLGAMTAHCRQSFKKDPFYTLSCRECDPTGKLAEHAPTSVSCLSDASRAHFAEVLEYIETLGIPYRINNALVPDRKYCSGTVFEIKEVLPDGAAGPILAVGFRHDDLSQKIGHKKENPAAGIKIFLKKKAAAKKIGKLPKPVAFYIQLGDEAKHKSLDVIEKLKGEKIYVHHMLGRDKFGSQFSLAEKSGVPYVIIMGKKEFLENSVMVRENATRTQVTIPVTELANYIKKLGK
ncbi:MAG: ATP phosphoribosyltransferase regulatory subunit [Patescibacteria group bacterium]|nr:ATP phosphoribosyltransferase regulatory subunit [Patescibacteria group bacterium]MDE1946058.1 ATP phosphoribosyltransferase regulatory subunit [Patescibacteria group bacterium]